MTPRSKPAPYTGELEQWQARFRAHYEQWTNPSAGTSLTFDDLFTLAEDAESLLRRMQKALEAEQRTYRMPD